MAFSCRLWQRCSSEISDEASWNSRIAPCVIALLVDHRDRVGVDGHGRWPLRPIIVNRRSDWTPQRMAVVTGQSASLIGAPFFVGELQQSGCHGWPQMLALDDARQPFRAAVPKHDAALRRR